MNTERELIQRLRDAHQSLERLLNSDAGDGFHNYVHHDKELIAAADAYLSKQDWIRVEDSLPEPGMPVIAYVPHYGGHTNSRRIRAQYAAKHSLEQHADAEGGDYDEVSDTYYCEPGWYEDNEYEEIHWRVSDEVTHWQPLPQPPEGSK